MNKERSVKMEKIGLFYGSDTGNTERVAELISEKIGSDKIDVIDLAKASTIEMNNYSKLIFGAPTWYDGELQSDWEMHFNNLNQINFKGKTVALFGLGDQIGYSEYFLDALGTIYDKIIELGAKVVGEWPCVGYDFVHSKASRNGHFVGLGIDEDNESEMTDDRIDDWLELIKPYFGI